MRRAMLDLRLLRLPAALLCGVLLSLFPAAGVWAAPKAPGAPPPDSSPLADLKKSNANLKKILAKQPANWTPEQDANKGGGRKMVHQSVYFGGLAKGALARHWDGLSPKQRTEFVATLRDLVERNYLKQI